MITCSLNSLNFSFFSSKSLFSLRSSKFGYCSSFVFSIFFKRILSFLTLLMNLIFLREKKKDFYNNKKYLFLLFSYLQMKLAQFPCHFVSADFQQVCKLFSRNLFCFLHSKEQNIHLFLYQNINLQ